MALYIQTQAGAMGVDAYVEQLVGFFVSLNLSPFGVSYIMEIINVDIPKLFECIFFFFFFIFFCLCFFLYCAHISKHSIDLRLDCEMPLKEAMLCP